jgi:hypothetical protein
MLRHREIRTVDADGEPVVVDSGARRARRSFLVTPAQIVSAVGGVALIAFGVFAVARAGLDSPLSDPQVQVLGLQHTAAIGLVELAVGAVLILFALNPRRAPVRWLASRSSSSAACSCPVRTRCWPTSTRRPRWVGWA